MRDAALEHRALEQRAASFASATKKSRVSSGLRSEDISSAAINKLQERCAKYQFYRPIALETAFNVRRFGETTQQHFHTPGKANDYSAGPGFVRMASNQVYAKPGGPGTMLPSIHTIKKAGHKRAALKSRGRLHSSTRKEPKRVAKNSEQRVRE